MRQPVPRPGEPDGGHDDLGVDDEVNATDGTGTAERRRQPSQVLLWVFAALVAAALLVGAVAGALRGPAELDPGSPEATVQAYLEAVIDGDHAAAAGYLAVDTARRCPASAFRNAWVPDGLTADLDDVRVRQDGADVWVRLRPVADPFSVDGSDFTETFTLVEERGHWRIAGDPWPLYACSEPPR